MSFCRLHVYPILGTSNQALSENDCTTENHAFYSDSRIEVYLKMVHLEFSDQRLKLLGAKRDPETGNEWKNQGQ